MVETASADDGSPLTEQFGRMNKMNKVLKMLTIDDDHLDESSIMMHDLVALLQ